VTDGSDEIPVVSPAQVRAARAWLYWSQQELAQRAGLSVKAVNHYENGDGSAHRGTIDRLRTALEEAGIEFRFTGAKPLGIGGPPDWRPRPKRK
jgi:transcriptional regulator with XRE-family HTH domain